MHQLLHLRDVAKDAMTRPWHAVQAWSQHIFDMIERGTYTWSDSQQIHNDRSMMTLATQHLPDHTAPRPGQAVREVVCQDFNSRSCQYGGLRKHHTEGNLRLIHICSYCMASSNQRCDSHSLPECDRKRRHTAGNSYRPPQAHQAPLYQHPNAGQQRTRQFVPKNQQQPTNLSVNSVGVPKN